MQPPPVPISTSTLPPPHANTISSTAGLLRLLTPSSTMLPQTSTSRRLRKYWQAPTPSEPSQPELNTTARVPILPVNLASKQAETTNTHSVIERLSCLASQQLGTVPNYHFMRSLPGLNIMMDDNSHEKAEAAKTKPDKRKTEAKESGSNRR
ncbi:hypothetical protein N656DRAFT_770933 [Canariomyces notabilis]|uniref:Uncharacterized protein n=1 Tax=Canariomyces notabilis TaxID=2074819 RepID=A0AAN6T9C5_9PEZI|nr:hypothetical protein N656DRAFT_770933 [Canariomyces arenarius]